MKKSILILAIVALGVIGCSKKDDIIDAQNNQIERLSEQVQFLAKTILGLNQQLSDSQAIIEAKTLEIAELNDIINTLSDDNAEMALIIEELQARVVVLLNDILDLTSVNEDLVGEIDTLNSMNDSLNADVTRLESELAYANSLLDDANALISSLEDENAQLKDELADALAKGVELKNKIKRKNRKIRKLKDQKQSLLTEIDQLDTTAEYYKDTVVRFQGVIARLDQDIKDYEAYTIILRDQLRKYSDISHSMIQWACNGGQRPWVCQQLSDIFNNIYNS